MKREIKDRWVAALRSRKFKQATGRLRANGYGQEHGYCCLGVLCELAIDDGVAERTSDGYIAGNEPLTGVLPTAVMRWAGMESDKGNFNGSSLVSLNDNYTSFDYIADVIEDYWPSL